jgi:hypothetical protein
MILSPPIACIATLHHDRTVLATATGVVVTAHREGRTVFRYPLEKGRWEIIEDQGGSIIGGGLVIDEEASCTC